ncbi:hypothetical protein WJX79_010683 [Trebouxia sp. C0005]
MPAENDWLHPQRRSATYARRRASAAQQRHAGQCLHTGHRQASSSCNAGATIIPGVFNGNLQGVFKGSAWQSPKNLQRKVSVYFFDQSGGLMQPCCQEMLYNAYGREAGPDCSEPRAHVGLEFADLGQKFHYDAQVAVTSGNLSCISISKLYVQDACISDRNNELGLKTVKQVTCQQTTDTTEKTCDTVFSSAPAGAIVNGSAATSGDYDDGCCRPHSHSDTQ